MNCPRCQAQLKVETYRGIEVDRCPKCKGMWLDYGELEQLEDTVYDQDESKGILMIRSFESELPCPKCENPMQRFSYRAYDLELDFCEQEHGVWLDAEEENQILKLMKQRGKDLNRKLSAEKEWGALLADIKSTHFRNKAKRLFRRK